MRRPPGGHGGRGFTLLEILVALAVLALSLGALISAGSSQTRNTAMLVERTLAQWVAANAVAEARIAGTWPEPGTRRGRSRLGDRDWAWSQTTLTTDDADLRRLEVEVRRADPDAPPLVTLVAYLARPAGGAR